MELLNAEQRETNYIVASDSEKAVKIESSDNQLEPEETSRSKVPTLPPFNYKD